MVNSMTAYGRAVGQTENNNFVVEIKSVNNRYLECNIKLPRRLSHLEEKVRSVVFSSGISRGGIDIYITAERLSAASGTVDLDVAYAESYINALRALSEKFDLHNDISTMRVAANRDIFITTDAPADPERDWTELEPILTEALEKYKVMRAEEGARLAADIAKKKASIKDTAAKVAKLAAVASDKYRARLEGRLRQVLSDMKVAADESRIITECAIYADKVAVDEELVRLGSHFEAFDNMLACGEPIGRKMDFLIQEMNREVNTIGSKCSDTDISLLVVDMKAEIEKIREQVQNIE